MRRVGRRALDLKVMRKGEVVAELRAEADPKDVEELRRLLEDVLRRDGRDKDQIFDYEMQVRYSHDRSRLITTFVATRR